MASLKYALKLERVVRRTNSLFVPFTCKRTLSTNVCCAKCQSEMVSDSKCKRSRNESQNFWTNRAFSTKPGVSENIVETLSQPAVQHSEEHPGGIQTNDSDEVIEVPEDLTEAAFIEVTGDAKIEKYAKLRLSRLTPEEEKLLKIIKLTFDVAMSTGQYAPKPEKMTDGRWLVLLVCRKTEARILKQLQYWAKLDFKIENDKKRKKKPPAYGGASDPVKHNHNKILRRIETTAMNVHYYNNLAYAMRFGQPLLLDLSFGSHMNVRTLQNTMEQIKYAHGVNKLLWDPFHLHFCNFPTEGKFYHLLKKMTDIVRPDLPITVTHRDVTELDNIPREKLVYLTPDSPHILKFNHDDVYVMGGIVDRTTIEPITYAKAKRLDIRTAKLPLDRYMVFQGDKTLTLNQVMLILTDLKKGVPMKTAVRHVPTRKVQRYLEEEEDDFIFVENRYA